MFREYTYWKDITQRGPSSLAGKDPCWYRSPVPAQLNLKAPDPGFIHPYLKESQDLTSKATDDLKFRISQQPEADNIGCRQLSQTPDQAYRT